MPKDIIILVLIGVIAVSAVAGFVGIMVGGLDPWTPRNYVTHSGDCWVKPQGDPLYDAHYAQEVNPYNCASDLTGAQADYIGAQTRQVNTETNFGVFGVSATFIVVIGVLIAITLAVVRG